MAESQQIDHQTTMLGVWLGKHEGMRQEDLTLGLLDDTLVGHIQHVPLHLGQNPSEQQGTAHPHPGEAPGHYSKRPCVRRSRALPAKTSTQPKLVRQGDLKKRE